MKLGPRAWVPLVILGVVGPVAVGLVYLTRPSVQARSPETSARLIHAERVTPEDVRFVVRAHGTVVPRTESDLVPQVSGEVIWVSPSLVSGGYFGEDEPLVRIDPADYEVELESARAAVSRSRSERERAGKERERQQRLRESAIASEARIDDAENAYRVADAALREARARLSRAQRDLERTELSAPYDGRVRSEDVDVGQFVNRGTAIATLYATDYAEVRLPLPDRELAFIDLPLSFAGEDGGGPAVTLRAEFAGESREWRGHIVRTEGEIDPRTRMVHVVARVDDPYHRSSDAKGPPLAVGLFVEAEILGRTVADAFRLPRQALREDDRVLLVDAESRLRFRSVEVLRIDEEEVVIGSGLSSGDLVCTSPLQAPVDGMMVRVAGATARTASGPSDPELARAPE